MALPVFGAGIPAIGPTATINLFSGPKASIPGFSSSQRIFRANPRPPIHVLANSSVKGSFFADPVVRFILSKLPVQPFIGEFSPYVFSHALKRLYRITQQGFLVKRITLQRYLHNQT